ncbi:putative (3S,6E)-nerolidol synthase [Medicago truncatula]|uniref:Putative (3S,6E)-nerolidol synthase n=1 Tax=Medicago truncatula TaxID=3880 RepID=A0A396IAS4_MEDTR|nr:putative (3S,6E)-nerolidol synthase [Medicago truncatula]
MVYKCDAYFMHFSYVPNSTFIDLLILKPRRYSNIYGFFSPSLHPTFPPNKSSTILEIKVSKPLHAYCSFYNKTNLTIALNKIHISQSGKGKDDLRIRHAKALELSMYLLAIWPILSKY